MNSKIPPHNQVALDRRFLIQVLDHFSERLYLRFGHVVRIVVHGGAVMVLHKRLLCRKFTRDVDYLHRSFELEWKQRGVLDAGQRMNLCIAETAEAFGLGLDWMNAHADVALPMSLDNRGHLFDPIHTDAMQPNNVQLNTIYSSRGLQLIGVSWSWAVALKLVRYQKDDPQDIAAILKLGTQFKGLTWTRRILEDWLLSMCSAMGYSRYSQGDIVATRQKMQDAIERAQAITWPSQSQPVVSQRTTPSLMPPDRPSSTHPNAHQDQTVHLRSRTKSLSHIASRPPSLTTASSMPHVLARASLPGYGGMPSSRPSSGQSHLSQVSLVPVPLHHLPPGFVPYYVTPPPQQFMQHRPAAPIRLTS